MVMISSFFFSSRRRHTRFKCDWSQTCALPILFELLGPLMSMIVLPYLGSRAAGREAGRITPRPAPRRPARPRAGAVDPLEGLKMRLTYRTVRVLMVIAERPAASNRVIAEQSGITDQGQISKLLGRLARLELVAYKGCGDGKCAP